MLKALRKYNKWILVVGGTMLMLAFLVQPAIQQLGGDPLAQPWATLDGARLRMRDRQRATAEVQALRALTNGLYPDSLPLATFDDSNEAEHWTLLVSEARQAGFVGESQDGAEWLPELRADADMQLFTYRIFGDANWRGRVGDPNFGGFLGQQYNTKLQEFTASNADDAARAGGRDLTAHQVYAAASRLRGVMRMLDAYFDAARVSDIRAATTGRREVDSAYVDYVFIPAWVGAGAVAEPDDAALQAFFDQHKTVKPGEGDHGVGYLLPDRIKLEWLTLNAASIREAITLDGVAVYKRYLTENKTRYPAEFVTERPNVERDMKAERLSEVMQAAHQTIQSEVRRVTRRLDSEGQYKHLPADWESIRPRLDAIAQAVVTEVKRTTGVTIPLPTVTVKAADWVIPSEVTSLEGIGGSSLQTGSLTIEFPRVVFGVRELASGAAESLAPVQVGIPLVDSAFVGPDQSRYYVNILDAQKESAPASFEEIRERVTRDYKQVKAFEGLSGRVEEFRSLATPEGLAKIIETAVPADVEPPPGQSRPEVRTRARVSRRQVSGTAPDVSSVNVEWFRDAVMYAANNLDPLSPPEQLDPAACTVGAALPSKLGVAVARITALQPLTRERFRVLDDAIVNAQQQRELFDEAGKPLDMPFTLGRLKERHRFITGDTGEEKQTGGSEAPAGS